MMVISPGDEDSDAVAGNGDGDAGAEEGGADAGAGGEKTEATPTPDDDEADDIDAVETGRVAPLSLLAQGDSLPLSYRSDNGTRESEFFVGDEKEKINPYYDVVRRLSPTELIGRFMRTSSPKVSLLVYFKGCCIVHVLITHGNTCESQKRSVRRRT